ncbi:MAG: DUF4358 domain-containing protein [Candidatus Heteroscillospira sp.]
MKKILTAAVLLMLLLLAACSGGSEYKDDVSLDTLASAVDASIDSEALVAMEDSYLRNAMQLEPDDFGGYVVKINSRGVNIDEYGIFKAPDADSVDEVQKAAEDYLQFRLDSWMSEYMPEELPKLENASVQVCGQYVMYAILADDSKEAAISAFEEALTK